jgi:hypothetical protein
MKISGAILTALVLSAATWSSQASAAVRESVGRDATMTKCLAEARKQYPGNYYDWGEVRDFAYRTCMFNSGYTE